MSYSVNTLFRLAWLIATKNMRSGFFNLLTLCMLCGTQCGKFSRDFLVNNLTPFVPVDHTRVILRDGDPSVVGSDYVNANLISGNAIVSTHCVCYFSFFVLM